MPAGGSGKKAGKLLKDAMEHVIELRVPLLAEVHQGTNWAEAKIRIGEREKEDKHAEGVRKRNQLNREKGVKGNCPLQGAGAAPLLGFGATPQLFRVKSIQREKSTKGAGSEASLPVTLRIRRCAPKLLYPPLAYCRARWARPTFRPKRQTPEHSIHCCIPALFVKQDYSITIQIYVVPSAIVYSRMLLAG